MHQIANYQVHMEIGRGGTSTVYLGKDNQSGREVAVKLLSQELASNEKARQRFAQEAMMLRELAHPAIVPILDFGEWNGQLFVVMPYYVGGSVRQKLDHGPLLLAESTRILNRIASALDAAHAKHIIHRDVKPHNILLDEDGNAFLSDFGIARFINQDKPEQTITLIGTPEFIAPEQATQSMLTTKTDVYQLGVTAYYMLTGRRPFTGHTLEVLTKHLTAEIPSAFESNGELPEQIDRVLTRAMAKDPAERYETAKAFIDEMIALTEHATNTYLLSDADLATLAIVAPASAPVGSGGSIPPSGSDVYTPTSGRSRKPLRWIVAGLVGTALVALTLFFAPLPDIGGPGNGGGGGRGGNGRGAEEPDVQIVQVDEIKLSDEATSEPALAEIAVEEPVVDTVEEEPVAVVELQEPDVVADVDIQTFALETESDTADEATNDSVDPVDQVDPDPLPPAEPQPQPNDDGDNGEDGNRNRNRDGDGNGNRPPRNGNGGGDENGNGNGNGRPPRGGGNGGGQGGNGGNGNGGGGN